MNLFDFFRASKKVSTASVAKERLQIIVRMNAASAAP